jgi:hypothetical protein
MMKFKGKTESGFTMTRKIMAFADIIPYFKGDDINGFPASFENVVKPFLIFQLRFQMNSSGVEAVKRECLFRMCRFFD